MLNVEIPKQHYHVVFVNNVIDEQRANTYTLIRESAMTDFLPLTGLCP